MFSWPLLGGFQPLWWFTQDLTDGAGLLSLAVMFDCLLRIKASSGYLSTPESQAH